MAISAFNLPDSIVGRSSLHTAEPLVAAHRFAEGLAQATEEIPPIATGLFGQLALMGRRNGTDRMTAAMKAMTAYATESLLWPPIKFPAKEQYNGK